MVPYHTHAVTPPLLIELPVTVACAAWAYHAYYAMKLTSHQPTWISLCPDGVQWMHLG